MNFAKRFLMVAGAGALAGILAMAIAPQAAHGLVAALVQVVNTPTTAVPVVQAPAASNVYLGACTANFNGFSGLSCGMPPTPVGRTLVIEAASIQSQTQTGSDPAVATLAVGDAFFYIPMEHQSPSGFIDNYTGQLQGRIFIPAVNGSSGITPTCTVDLGIDSSLGAFNCTISGYTIPAN
jgi:hypothetical protein